MSNSTDPSAQTVHGTNPQYLIEKITRLKIYNSTYWKEECFGLTTATIIDKAVALKYIGGTYGGNNKPSKFLCLLLKVLQLQPDHEIILEFIRNDDFKYLRALGAMYLRLTSKAEDVYRYLEPLYNDYRPMIHRSTAGWSVTHMDEFIDSLLREELVCDIALPFIMKRLKLEELNALPPRKSVMEEELAELERLEQEEEDEEQDQVEFDNKPGDDKDVHRESPDEIVKVNGNESEDIALDSNHSDAVDKLNGREESISEMKNERGRSRSVSEDKHARLSHRSASRSPSKENARTREFEKIKRRDSRDRYQSRYDDDRDEKRKTHETRRSRDRERHHRDHSDSRSRSRSRSDSRHRRHRDKKHKHHKKDKKHRRHRSRDRSRDRSDSDRSDNERDYHHSHRRDSRDRDRKYRDDDYQSRHRHDKRPRDDDGDFHHRENNKKPKQEENDTFEAYSSKTVTATKKPSEKAFDKIFGKKGSSTSNSTSNNAGGGTRGSQANTADNVRGKVIVNDKGEKFVITASEGTVEYWNQMREALGMKKLRT